MRKVKKVTPLDNFRLELVFDNNEVKVFDVKPYMNRGIFTELKSPDYFKEVRIFFDSITWPNGQDFDPDHLYIESHNLSLHRTP